MNDAFQNAQLTTLRWDYYCLVARYRDEQNRQLYGWNMSMEHAIKESDISVQPYIKYDKTDGLHICLDVERITDDSMFEALDTLWFALQEHPNLFELDQFKIYTGAPRKFELKDLYWIVEH